MKIISFQSLVFLLLFFVSCQNGKRAHTDGEYSGKPGNTKLINVVRLGAEDIIFGNEIEFEWLKTADSVVIDSVVIWIDGKKQACIVGNFYSFEWNSLNGRLGKLPVVFYAYSSALGVQRHEIFIQLLSNFVPKEYTYKIEKVLPHSRENYTQGLIFDNGVFYESVGQYGKSALKKIKYPSGELINMAACETSMFAEGIALRGDEVYQISWKERVGIVYDKYSFKQLRRFTYDIAEGWGLEYNGKHFLMTDGSNVVYFIEPESFTVVRKLEVMDNNGPVINLNELELINGKLYANIYTSNYVVIIDTATGKVTGRIDFSGLLKEDDLRPDTDVLNGIAYNTDNGNLFVTGKNWPKMFEVSIVEK